jgi:CubicO group peptidase (beta-lactamase class C family)
MKTIPDKIFIFISVFFLLMCGCKTSKQNFVDSDFYYPSDKWIFQNTEESGWSEKKLKDVEQHFKDIKATALMIVDNGYVVASYGDIERRINCFSVRKSFLSALYGIAVYDGKIDISATLGQLGIDDKESLSDKEKSAKVSDLLKSKSGIYHPAAYETVKMKETRPKRGSHLPGEYWYYNNWDFNTLATIYEKQTSENLFESFYNRIALAIKMEDFTPSDGKYIKEDTSIHPAYPFWMSTRDRARFGLLYLRNGVWNGNQIIPKKWIEDSTNSYSRASNGAGYGYLWWVRDKSYSASGNHGQNITIFPDYNIVIALSVDYEKDKVSVSGQNIDKLMRLILNAR